MRPGGKKKSSRHRKGMPGRIRVQEKEFPDAMSLELQPSIFLAFCLGTGSQP